MTSGYFLSLFMTKVRSDDSYIKRILTKTTSISDHCYLLADILAKPHIELPKFRRVRNWAECTVENLRVEVLASEGLQTLYALTDPQVIDS